MEVGKVKAEEFYFVERSCLSRMISENVMKSCMKQVSCCMVLHDAVTTIGINDQGVFLIQGKWCQYFNGMEWLTIWCFLNVCNICYDIPCSIQDLTMVRYLSTHFSVERSFSKDERCSSFGYSFYFCIVRYDSYQFRRQLASIIVKVTFNCNVLKSFILHAHRSTFNS